MIQRIREWTEIRVVDAVQMDKMNAEGRRIIQAEFIGDVTKGLDWFLVEAVTAEKVERDKKIAEMLKERAHKIMSLQDEPKEQPKRKWWQRRK